MTGLFSPTIALYLCVFVTAMILLLSGRVRTDVAAILILCTLGLLNLLPHTVLFSGFASDTVVSLIALMIVGAGLDKVGLLHYFAQYLDKFKHRSRTLMLAILGIC